MDKIRYILCGDCYLMQEHHLKPACGAKPREGPKVWVCRPCHKFLHSKIGNGMIHERLNTVEQLKTYPMVVDWLKRKKHHGD